MVVDVDAIDVVAGAMLLMEWLMLVQLLLMEW